MTCCHVRSFVSKTVRTVRARWEAFSGSWDSCFRMREALRSRRRGAKAAINPTTVSFRFLGEETWRKRETKHALSCKKNTPITCIAPSTIDVDQKAREWLADQGYSDVYGARAIARVVRTKVLFPLAQKMLKGTIR